MSVPEIGSALDGELGDRAGFHPIGTRVLHLDSEQYGTVQRWSFLFPRFYHVVAIDMGPTIVVVGTELDRAKPRPDWHARAVVVMPR